MHIVSSFNYSLIQLICNIILKPVCYPSQLFVFRESSISCLLIQNMTDLTQGCSAATRLGWAEWNKRISVTISKSNSTSARLRHAAVVLTQLRYGRSLRSQMELPGEKQELTQIYNIPFSMRSVWRQTHFCKIISS